MPYETLYTILNLSVLPGWLLLIFLPRSAITRTIVHSMLYPALLGAAYIVLFILYIFLGLSPDGGGFSSASGVSAIFSHPMGVLIGWTHYLVFDLFIGAWEARDAQRRGVPHLALVPCLGLTLMLGPVGLLAYLILRLSLGKGAASLTEA